MTSGGLPFRVKLKTYLLASLADYSLISLAHVAFSLTAVALTHMFELLQVFIIILMCFTKGYYFILS